MESPQDIYSRSSRRLRRSNTQPTEAEMIFAKDLLPVAEAELHHLDAALELLLAQRARADDQVERCKITLAPHKKLPLKLISQILELNFQEPARLPIRMGELDPRIQITQVCSAWRSAAFSSTRFANIHISGVSGYSSAVLLASAWFRQASEFNPQISLEASIDHVLTTQQDQISFDMISQLIVPYADHFTSLSLTLTSHGVENLLHIPNHSFDRLEYLSLTIEGHQHSLRVNEETSPSTFVSSPRLRSLRLVAGLGYHWEPHFPWSQLTFLHILGVIQPLQHLSLLSQCTSLRSAQFIGISEPESAEHPNFTVQLPHITSLDLTFISRDPSQFLNSLHLPNISRLCLGPLQQTLWSQGSCASFFRAISPTLRHFETATELSWVELDDALLRWIPNVRTVILKQDYYLTRSTMHLIASGELLPKVEHMEFCSHDLQPVVQMLLKRRSTAKSPDTPLSSITSVKVYCRTGGFRFPLKRLIACGIDIQVKMVQ